MAVQIFTSHSALLFTEKSACEAVEKSFLVFVLRTLKLLMQTKIADADSRAVDNWPLERIADFISLFLNRPL